MDWKAANEQQQEALWRIFLMFVVMALLVIRTGLVSRGVVAALLPEKAQRDAAPTITRSPADLHHSTLALLCLAEVAGGLFILNARAVWELMNQPLPRPAQEQPSSAASLCEDPAQRLDTS